MKIPASLKRQVRPFILKIALVILVFLHAGCSSEGDLADFGFDEGLLFGSFTLIVSNLLDIPQGSLTPPPAGSVPGISHPGVTLDFRDHYVTLTPGAINVVGSTVNIELTMRNNSGATLFRAWLIVHSPNRGVQLDDVSADGYIGDGVYYFLGTLLDGEEKQVTISLVLPAILIDEFQFSMDIADIYDRIVFSSTQEFLPTEIFSITPSGADLARLTFHEGALHPSNPRWSPDGGWVAYSAGIVADDQIWLARADGGGAQQLTCYNGYILPGDFTRDGSGMYVRRYDPALVESNLYLLDIAAARNDCSDMSALTPLTVIYPGSENLPILSPSGDMLVYLRREIIPVEDPDPTGLPTCGAPPEPCCGSPLVPWTPKYVEAFNMNILPMDPATGLPDGTGELLYLYNSLCGRGEIALSPDGASVVSNAGGCAERQACCPGQSGCPAGSSWKMKCNLFLPRAMYRLDVRTDLPDPMPYNYIDVPGSGFYHKFDGTKSLEDSPSWSIEYDMMVFSHLEATFIQLWYFDPFDPANTRTQLTNFGYYNTNPRFMPWPESP